MDVWIRRSDALAAGGYDYTTLAQVPLADAAAFQASSLPSKGWALCDAPPAPAVPAPIDPLTYLTHHAITHLPNGVDPLPFSQTIFAGGPSTPITGTTPTLFSLISSVTPAIDARYEFEASGPLSTPLLGSSFALAIRVGNVNVVAASPISVAGSLANVGWWMRGRLHFQTLTAVDADIMVQTVSALGTVQTALKSTTQAAVVPSGAQVWGVETTFGATGASATANGLTIKRVQ